MSRKVLVAAVVIACAAAAIYVFTSGFDFSRFLASLWKINPWWMAASITVSLATYIFRAYRWRVLLKPVRTVSIRALFETTLVGFSTIFILGRAGEVARPLWLLRREKVPFSASVATLIAERCLDLISLIAIFAWALFTVEVSSESAKTLAMMKSGAWLVLAGSLGGLLGLIVLSWSPGLVLRLVPFERGRSIVRSFADGLAFLNSARSLGLSLWYSAIIWIGIVFQFWFLLLSMDFRWSAAAATMVLGGTAIGSIAQIPGIGGGFQVAFAFCMTTFFAVSKEQAIAAALVAWVTSYVPTVACTAVYLAASGVQMRDLKSVLRQEKAASAGEP